MQLLHCSLPEAPLESARQCEEPALFMNTSTAIADPLFQLSPLVSREAYLANKEEVLTLSVLRFTLHEIRFTRTGLQVILR